MANGKQLLPGAITDEQWKDWNKYQEAGGELQLYEWVDAGALPIEEERATLAYFERLGAYLRNEIATGAMDESQALVIAKDEYDQVYGRGAYKGEPKKFFNLSNYSKVTTYIRGLPEQEQRRIEQEARATQQQAEDIARQQTELPLGAGGKVTDQIQAGQQAIRNLQIQLGVAPEYMRDTLKSQINALQQGIDQLWQTERERARERAIAEEAPTKRQIEERAAEELRQEPRTFAREFASKYGMSAEAAQQTGLRYQADPGSEEFAGLTKEEKRDLAWVGTETVEEVGAPKAPVVEPFQPPEFKELVVAGTERWKSWFANRYPSIAREFISKEERTVENWAQYLQKERARIQEEFAKQSYGTRGEQPWSLAPRIRTVTW